MFRNLTLAAAAIAVMVASPVPVLTGAAYAQAACGPNHCPPNPGPSTYECSDQLGYLRRVYEAELAEVDDSDLVSVVPICMGESYGMMRSDGNAGALRGIIADSDAMTEALFRKNFVPDDVVGIRMVGDEEVVLFVHPMHRL